MFRIIICIGSQVPDTFEYEIEDRAFANFRVATLLYPTANIKLIEELYYEATSILKEHNPRLRFTNPYAKDYLRKSNVIQK